MGVVKPRDIAIEIDELVLHGFPLSERDRIVESVTTELTRIVAERGLPQPVATPADGDTLRGGSFTLRRGEAGLQIAEAIYVGLEHGE